VQTPEELWQIEFARDFERDADPRRGRFCDSFRDATESDDWHSANRVLEDMWKAQVIPEAWMYHSIVETCRRDEECEHEGSDAAEMAARLTKEVQSWGSHPSVERFQMAPRVAWERELMMCGCQCHNTLDWKGRRPVPTTARSVWLLPAQDDASEHIAEHELQLRQAGWKIIAVEQELLGKLRDKGELFRLAEELGIAKHFPMHFTKPAEAKYPLIVKPARGTWGKDTIVAYSAEEVLRTACRNKIHEVERLAEQRCEYELQCHEMTGSERDHQEWWARQSEETERAVNDWIEEAQWEDLGDGWVMQEFITGAYEYSTTLLMAGDEILDYFCSRYEFASETYVWPALEYHKAEYIAVPAEHLRIMKTLLAGFNGICNVNYKIRKNGEICIFEVNPRVGGDLIFDVPKKRVRSMFEKLDAMF
jgi:hypothetical protein